MIIDYGNTTPTIAQQLREQKLNYDSQFIKSCEKVRHSIATLVWNQIIDSKQEKLLINRLTKKIQDHIWKRKQK